MLTRNVTKQEKPLLQTTGHCQLLSHKKILKVAEDKSEFCQEQEKNIPIYMSFDIYSIVMIFF